MRTKFNSRRRIKPIPLCIATMAVVFGAGTAAAADSSVAPDILAVFPHVRVVNAPQLATQPAKSVVQTGLRAYIDPATGMLRAPTAEDLQQESADAARADALHQLSGPSGDTQFVTASGAIGVALGESSMVFSVVQKADGGGLNEFCVVGPEAMSRLMTFKAPASSALSRKEVRYDR